MKRLAYISCLFIFPIVTSCNDTGTYLSNSREDLTDSKYLSIEEASIQANILKGKIYGEETRSNSQRVKSVECFYPKGKTRSGEDALYYILNYGEENGFAVVSATEEAPGVYALSDSGSLTMSDTINNPGLAAFFAMLPSTLGAIGGIDIPVIPPKDTTTHDLVVMPELTDCSSKLNPLLSKDVRSMHQNSPYNNCCFTSSGGEAAVGCSPLAIAMIMSFFETPKSYGSHSYNWAKIKNHNSDAQAIKTSTLPELLNDLGLSKNLNVKYGYPTTSSSLEKYYKRTFENFGYNKPRDFQTFTSSDIHHFLSIKKTPCLMMGRDYAGGHAWVCDGYYNELYRTAFGDFCGNGLFLHMVWGQQTNYNGYFKFGNSVIPAEKYNVDGDRMIWTEKELKEVQYYDMKFVADFTTK